MSEEKGLKILKAEIKNFKNISYREVDFNGKSAVIVGPNGVGKSSLIQAICSPINSKFIPAEPVKSGEQKAEVILTIGGIFHGEEVSYRIGCYFSEENKRGKLVLRNSEGTEIGSAKTNLNQIIGNISFDIMEFMRLAKTESGKISESGVKKQIELVKSLMGKEAIKKLNELDALYKEKYDERTDVNRDIKYVEQLIEKSRFSIDDIDKYSEKLSSADILEQIEKAKNKNNIHLKCKQYISSYESRQGELFKDITLLLEKYDINDKDKFVEEAVNNLREHKLKACQAYVDKNEMINVEDLNNKLSGIDEHNEKHNTIIQIKEKEKELRLKQKQAKEITDLLASINQDKLDIFQSANLPVKGLSFNDECVMYDGLPLTEEQHPTSRLIKIGLEIGMALNPNLRLLVIKDGSLLDEKSMKYILKTCEEKDYQLLIEKVLPEGDELSVEFVER